MLTVFSTLLRLLVLYSIFESARLLATLRVASIVLGLGLGLRVGVRVRIRVRVRVRLVLGLWTSGL
jgi:hypothetical protein